MNPLITPQQMRAMEQRYFTETGTPSIDLMEVAARSLNAAIARRYGPGKTVYFACGPGGNGGDGYACARLYAKAGGKCALFPAAPAKTPDAIANRERALAMGIPELSCDSLATPTSPPRTSGCTPCTARACRAAPRVPPPT